MRKPVQKTTPNRNGSKNNKPTASATDHSPNTKTETVLAMLEARKGATITELTAATGWQQHSVRGFLSGTVKRRLGHSVASEAVDGQRRYRIAG